MRHGVGKPRAQEVYTVAMKSKIYSLLLFATVALADATALRAAEPAPFDLAGPIIAVTVTHGGKTLPVSQVPNLAVGDRLWIKADLPPTQSAHYIMVAAFLRGATNPPPARLVFSVRDMEPSLRAGRFDGNRAAGRPAVAAVPGTGDRRRLQDSGQGGSRPSRGVRASLAGPEPGDAGSCAPGGLYVGHSRHSIRAIAPSSRTTLHCWRAAWRSR